MVTYPTVIAGDRDRLSQAQASGNLIGREDIEYAEEISMDQRWKNPATLVTMKMNRTTSKTIDTHWWDDEHVPYTDQINYDTGYADSATGLVVDNVSHFALGDIVKDDASGENMLVTSKGSTYIGVVRDFGQATESWTAKKASIDDNTWLVVVGNAYEPGHPTPKMKSTTEVERINYHQDLRTGVAASDIVVATKWRGPQDLDRLRDKRAGDHQSAIETSFWDGKPYRGDKANYDEDTGNTAPPTCGGINHYIEEYGDSDKVEDQVDITFNEFMDWIEACTDKKREMFLWCPSKLRYGMDRWGISKQNTFENTTRLGMAISEWNFSECKIFIMSHEYLKAHDSASWNRAFMLDHNEIEMSFLNDIGSTTHKNLVVADGATLVKEEYRTIFSFRFSLPKTHGRLRFRTVNHAA